MKKTLAGRIEGLMYEDAVTTWAHLILYLFSLVYGLAVAMRLLLYSAGVMKAARLPCRVISVGNITVGGTGKTPVAMLIAGLIRKEGGKVVILSRGYKRRSKGLVIVSDYASILATVQEAGDEPYLMAKRLAGVPVVVSSDRVASGRIAYERFKPDYIILDDGFQHIGLLRDVNILLVDGNAGFGNGHLLPAGILREPVAGAGRASFVMVKNGQLNKGVSQTLRASGLQAVNFTYKLSSLLDVSQAQPVEISVASIRARKALAIAGLANPASFFKSLEILRVKVVKTLAYPDHHWFTPDDIKAIMRTVVDSGADILITTEKDAVRLNPHALDGLPIYALSVDAVCDEAALRRLIFDAKAQVISD